MFMAIFTRLPRDYPDGVMDLTMTRQEADLVLESLFSLYGTRTGPDGVVLNKLIDGIKACLAKAAPEEGVVLKTPEEIAAFLSTMGLQAQPDPGPLPAPAGKSASHLMSPS